MTVSHCHAVYYLKMVCVSVPTPSVNVTVPDGTLYAGTNVTLNCTIQLDGAIDTVVDVTVLWTGPPGGTVLSTTGERITVSDVTGSRPSYQSTVNITPLISNDNGAYTCEATVSPNPTSEFITMSGAGSDSGTVTVEGEACYVFLLKQDPQILSSNSEIYQLHFTTSITTV